MKITEITASVGRTIQMQAYEPVTLHASAKVEVAEGEDVREAYKLAFDSCKKEIEDRSNAILKKKLNSQPA